MFLNGSAINFHFFLILELMGLHRLVLCYLASHFLILLPLYSALPNKEIFPYDLILLTWALPHCCC